MPINVIFKFLQVSRKKIHSFVWSLLILMIEKSFLQIDCPNYLTCASFLYRKLTNITSCIAYRKHPPEQNTSTSLVI